MCKTLSFSFSSFIYYFALLSNGDGKRKRMKKREEGWGEGKKEERKETRCLFCFHFGIVELCLIDAKIQFVEISDEHN